MVRPVPTMQTIRRLAAIVALLLAFARAVPAQEQRNVVEPLAIWNAVGRVNIPTGFCTGTLIAPDQVLTAAHCVADPRSGRLLAPDRIHFLAGFRRGGFAAHVQGRAVRTAQDLQLDQAGHPTRLDRDWAILVLERPIADGNLLQPLPLGNAGSGPGMLVGYGRDRPYLPSRQEPCPVLGRPEGSALLLHACLAPNGMSGAPFLQRQGNRWMVVGVHIASVDIEGGKAGAVVAMRRSLPAGALR